MPLSNAERQKRFRERRNEAFRAVTAHDHGGVDIDSPEAARVTLSALARLAWEGRGEMDLALSADDTAVITLTCKECLDALQATPFSDFIDEAILALWEEGHPIQFDVTVTARADRRAVKTKRKELDSVT